MQDCDVLQFGIHQGLGLRVFPTARENASTEAGSWDSFQKYVQTLTHFWKWKTCKIVVVWFQSVFHDSKENSSVFFTGIILHFPVTQTHHLLISYFIFRKNIKTTFYWTGDISLHEGEGGGVNVIAHLIGWDINYALDRLCVPLGPDSPLSAH